MSQTEPSISPLPDPLDIRACDEFFEAIAAERKRLEAISKTEDGDAIMIEGETTAGYFCHMMVDPKDVAKITLEYNYPVWHILQQDYPDGMREDLGRKFGLATVCSIDLWGTL